MFPRLDPKVYPIKDDRQFLLELLQETRVMLVQGTGFNWPTPDHFRIVFLPHEDDLREAVGRRLDFLLQEFNREANTLGSKSVDARTSNAAVELKVLIDQIREQVQNIE